MIIKKIFLSLTLILFISILQIKTEDPTNVGENPTPSQTQAPAQAQSQAPAQAQSQAPVHAQTQAPVQAQTQAPAQAPTSSLLPVQTSFQKDCSTEVIEINKQAEKVCGARLTSYKNFEIMTKLLKETIQSSTNLCSRDKLSAICCETLSKTLEKCEGTLDMRVAPLQKRMQKQVLSKIRRKL